MLGSAKIRHLGLLLLLANALLVGVAAVLRHATADDTTDGVAAHKSAVPPTVAAAAQASDLPAPAAIDAAFPIQSSSSSGAADPVLDELRKMLRDPSSGLEVPSIPLSGSNASAKSQVGSLDRWTRLQQRVESVHHVSRAAHKLTLEAQRLAHAGEASQAELIMQQVAQLHAIIARLTAAD